VHVHSEAVDVPVHDQIAMKSGTMGAVYGYVNEYEYGNERAGRT